jgi:hypothetical protein
MKYLVAAFIFVLQLLSISGSGQKTFDFNERCKRAYREIIQLRLKSGQGLLDEEKKTNRDNLIPYFLENYIDFFVLFFNEDPAEYQSRKSHWDQRIQLMKQGPDSSAFYLFTQSLIHFQWAAVKIKFDKNWDAALDFRRSFLQNNENRNRFSSFAPDAMLGGAMEVAAGTIPDGYKWLSNFLGIKGSINGGMKELKQFLGQVDPWAQLFHDEAVFYYLYLEYYIENKKDEVFTYILSNKLDLKNNQLFTFLATNLAVNDLQSAFAAGVILGKNSGANYLDMPVWDMEMGNAQLYHLDPSAGMYLERFIRLFKGKFYVKDVLQKLSWFYYLQDDPQKANAYRQQVLDKGNTETEADKQAFKEAGTGKWPEKTLLKSRLLNDGGYHLEAYQLLQGKNIRDFPLTEDKTEFVYRLGRIEEDLGRTDEAIGNYLITIKLGEGQKEYFAARAALQLGWIYEKRQNTDLAISYFKKCLGMRDHDYKNSLDQKAKAGIARCRGE